ncbi:tRNA (adenosine(37)-N6)-threonylcarbamoyltransferase complex ATPase subunit type 1 TsaE [Falsihalocynthiibacter sp. SS001]|uniref:tRNA (adenosine(37)-N6)-threonylcarbamoyltransferase complex ATPase subunit type 1 TsaE n=1 Tax=Falsihalocynthiibacter sp. SS001 TaxID=3349698 RepID=UPI0036D3B177
MSSFRHQISLSSPEDTARLAKSFAGALAAGDTVLLEGPIGAGKSFFCRALIQELLDAPEDIPSPTFTIVQTYDGRDFPIWHCDLYRLTHPDEAWELGLDEAFENSLCLIEWPDRLGQETPENALWLNFASDGGDARKLTLSSNSDHWEKLREGLDA